MGTQWPRGGWTQNRGKISEDGGFRLISRGMSRRHLAKGNWEVAEIRIDSELQKIAEQIVLIQFSLLFPVFITP